MNDDTTMLSIPTLHVADIELPREFEKLYELAYNLWWTWSPEARALFSSIDGKHWSRYRNPVEVLINVEPKQWHRLLDDASFRNRYQQVTQAFERYMGSADQTWFQENQADFPSGPVAYFSMEFGLHTSIAVYSGGLGVLSGDHCKTASDLGIPLIAFGLLYRNGYFQQTIDAEGWQQHTFPDYDFNRLPLRPVATATGREVKIQVPLPGREVTAQLWLAQVGRVPLILLDTDLPENDPADRSITNILYVQGREIRLVQELLLGRGGVRALQAIGVEPRVWHLNEGHSVFLQLERLRHLVLHRGVRPAEALQRLTQSSVFTTHTPVPAGNEQFDPDLVRKYLSQWCEEVGVSMDQLLALGRASDHEHSFNLTALAIRTSSYANGVSKLNAEVASDMWRHLFPEGQESQPVDAITNGVHISTWIGFELRELLLRHFGEDWVRLLLEPEAWQRVMDIPDREIWAAHLAQKQRLANFTRATLRAQLARQGGSPDELRAIEGLFNVHALTLGFARRFATYKRASLIFSDLERLKGILGREEQPLQIIFAGKAHPADRPGQELIRNIFHLSRSEQLAGRVFFLENYDMRMGGILTQGVDVWLNTPRRPLEASGTSGQKAAANGALNCSILDGWWPEGYNGNNGWVIGSDTVQDSEAQQDQADVQSLYETLENSVLPLYYDRDEDGLPTGWIRFMKESIATLTPAFSSSRMVRDYAVRAYRPAADRSLALELEQARG